MSQNVDRAGVFIFEVVEGAVGVTSKNSYPQWVARLKTVQKWVDTQEEMTHYKLTEPGYVEWLDQEILAYLVLFNSSDTFTVEGQGKTAMLNYDQLKLALGWDGTEFDTLADGTMVGKKILGRVEEDTYNEKTSLKVQWIAAVDAPPNRALKSLAPDAVSALTAKLKINIKKPTAAPAKPVTAAKPGKPSAPAASAPSTAASTAAASVASTATTTAPAQTAPSSPAPAPKAKKKQTPPPPAAVKEESTGLSKTCTKDAAWEHVCNNKGETTDDGVSDAWLAACGEVGENKDEDKFTEEDWAKVRDICIKDLAL